MVDCHMEKSIIQRLIANVQTKKQKRKYVGQYINNYGIHAIDNTKASPLFVLQHINQVDGCGQRHGSHARCKHYKGATPEVFV